ncbi:hypothetical protein [Inmirania thermothiophila]|uniref:MSHA biogenesis protein MshP n=1 Tax=Inmirania thermothiophila TaxID=1750597 RepID=A0A3N1Y5W0_9GAMM|nr:hypothetical protein [Inmirania thermothiophila]ROR34195.1 MSHA biogenesis protein MshP [Inmirania thermothiophila]
MRGRGFATVTAVFLLVVLAAIATYLLTVAGAQRETARYAVQGARAYQAALAGIEWALHQIAPTGAAAPSAACGTAPATDVATTFTVAAGGGADFTVTVVCRYTEHRERADDYAVYEITSTAETGAWGSLAYVRRRIRTVVTDAP